MPLLWQKILFWEQKLVQASPDKKSPISGSNNQNWPSSGMQSSGNPGLHFLVTLLIRFILESHVETDMGLSLKKNTHCCSLSFLLMFHVSCYANKAWHIEPFQWSLQ